MNVGSVLTRGTEQTSTEARARGEDEMSYYTNRSSTASKKRKRLLSAACTMLHVGDNIH